MAFTQFNRAGHKMLSAEIQQELQDLAQRHDLDISAGGGNFGENEFTVHVKCKTNDAQAVEATARRNFAISCRGYGLEPHHYGTEFSYGGDRFRLTGIKSSRPKYPISGVCLRTKRTFKLPTATVSHIKTAYENEQAKKAANAKVTGVKVEDDQGMGFAGEWA